MLFAWSFLGLASMELLESSFDLLHNPLFSIVKREPWMMPSPFVLTDAVVLKQTLKLAPIVSAPPIAVPPRKPLKKERLRIVTDTTTIN